jgi:hypothetical protein
MKDLVDAIYDTGCSFRKTLQNARPDDAHKPQRQKFGT